MPVTRRATESQLLDLAEQLERIREMERNGELAPAPGVIIEPTSHKEN